MTKQNVNGTCNINNIEVQVSNTKQSHYYYLAVVDDHRPKLFPCLGIVKGSTSFADLDQQGLPLGQIFT